ncbi:hypothetical protein ACW69H_03020 [Streptomyces sp. SS10]
MRWSRERTRAGVEGGAGADLNGEFLRCFGCQMKLLREAAG